MNTTREMIVTGTKIALRKLAAKVGSEVREHPRTGALYVSLPLFSDQLSPSADARSDGSVAYRLVDGTNVVAHSLGDFLNKCSGYTPRLHPENVQRFVAIQNGVICRL